MPAILFDLEGTLVESPTDDPQIIKQFRTELIDLFLSYDVPNKIIEKEASSTSLLQNEVLSYLSDQLTLNQFQLFQKKLDAFLIEKEIIWAKDSRPFPDSIATLRKLRNNTGYKIGLVTNTSRIATKIMLADFKIDNFIQATVTRNDVTRLKPDPEGILKILKDFQVKDFCFVGNSQNDCDATKRAGGFSIILTKNPQSKKYKPDFFINTLSEVPSLIDSVYSK